MTTQTMNPFQNEVTDRQFTDQNAATHIDSAQLEVDTARRTTGQFAGGNMTAGKTTDQLPTSNVSDTGFSFAPAIDALKNKLIEAVESHPGDETNKQEYYRFGPDGEMYAHDTNGERLVTSKGPLSTFIERTKDGIKGIADKLQFTASNDTQHKQLAFNTLLGKISIERSTDGAYHIDIDNGSGPKDIVATTEAQLKSLMPMLNSLLQGEPTDSKEDQSQKNGTNDTTSDASNTAKKSDSIDINFKTGIATITGGDNRNIDYDFKTGDLGVGGLGLGHFVFHQNGSTMMSNGDVIDSHGVLTRFADTLANKSDSELSSMAATAQSNAQSLAAGILAKGGNEEISPDEISTLMSLDASLMALEHSFAGNSAMISLAHTAIATALAKAMASRPDKSSPKLLEQRNLSNNALDMQNANHSENNSVLFFESPYKVQQQSRT